MLIIVGVVLPTMLSSLPSLDAAVHAQAALRTAWAVMFVCAGLFRLVCWRLTRETPTALLGAGMVCFGLLSAPTTALAQLIHDSQGDIILSPVTRAVAVTAFLIALGRSFRSAPVDARISPVRTIAATLLIATAVLGAFIAMSHLGTPINLPARSWMAVGISDAVAWLIIAAIAVARGIRRSSASYVWIGLGLLLMSTAELLHALAFVGPPSLAFFSTCLQVVVGTIALANSAADLGLVFSADGNRMLSLTGALCEAEEMRTEEEKLQAERLHDARSVIAALKAASLILDRYDERLDTDVKHRLRSSLVTELTRLEKVIAGRRQEPLQVFRLDAALRPLLIAERENGLEIVNKLGSVRALGRPLELATVVQNLLVNVRRHAPGSIVRLTARSQAGRVQLFIEDRGPGVDPTQHELVFQRGYRCRMGNGDGSGLGLFLARRLMREQGGEIVLRDRDGGGASFVLSLQGPSALDQPQDGVKIHDTVNGAKDGPTDERDGSTLADLPRQRDDKAASGGASDVVRDDKVHHPTRRRGRRHLQST